MSTTLLERPAVEIDKIALRVRSGATFLDARVPGWAGQIATERLDMRLCDRCIWGQLYGHFLKGFKALDLDHFDVVRAAELGFMLLGSGHWHQLTDLWRDEIRARTAEVSP